MKTRTKKTDTVASRVNTSTNVKNIGTPLETAVKQPPHIFIIPKHVSTNARIITLPNPATSDPARYLVCPEYGFFEFSRVTVPHKECRSWLLSPSRRQVSTEPVVADTEPRQGDTHILEDDAGYILQSPDLLVATPIDPLFLLLPALTGDEGNAAQEFLAISDYLTILSDKSPQLRQMLRSGCLEKQLESRIEAVCERMDMGDETMYTLSLPMLVKVLVAKAKSMSSTSLPSSLEKRRVEQALEVPVTPVTRAESSTNDGDAMMDCESNPGAESQSTTSEIKSQNTDASATSVQTISTIASTVSCVPTESTIAESIVDLLRLRTALDFISASYISPGFRTKLESQLSESRVAGVDFTALDEQLTHVAKLKKEEQVLRSISDNISRKRSNVFEHDDNAMEMAEAKRRKKEEDELRKKNTSHGVKKLMKADTSGMKKLSAFFRSGTAATKR